MAMVQNNSVTQALPTEAAQNAQGFEQDLQAVTEAKDYVNNFTQWLIDHPGKAPEPEMIDRFKKENQFLADQYTW